jgi:hypothetical protein
VSRLFVFNLFQVNPLQVDWNNGEAQDDTNGSQRD